MSLTRYHPKLRNLPYTARVPEEAVFSGETGVYRYSGFLDASNGCCIPYQPLLVVVTAYCCDDEAYVQFLYFRRKKHMWALYLDACWKREGTEISLISDICTNIGENPILDVDDVSAYQLRLQTAFSGAESIEGFTLQQTLFWDLNPEFVCAGDIPPPPPVVCPAGFMYNEEIGYCVQEIQDTGIRTELVYRTRFGSSGPYQEKMRLRRDRSPNGTVTLFGTANGIPFSWNGRTDERETKGIYQDPQCGQSKYVRNKVTAYTQFGFNDVILQSLNVNDCFTEEIQGCVDKFVWRVDENGTIVETLSQKTECDSYDTSDLPVGNLPPTDEGCWITDVFYGSFTFALYKRVIFTMSGTSTDVPDIPGFIVIENVPFTKVVTFSQTFIQSSCPTDLSYLYD